MTEHSNRGIFFSYTTLCVLDNSATCIHHPSYRLKGNHTAYRGISKLFEYFFSPQPVRCLQQHWGTPEDQNSWGGSSLWMSHPAGAHKAFHAGEHTQPQTTAPHKMQSRTTLLSSQARDSRRSLSSAGKEEQGHSRAAAQDPPLHACSFKPLQAPQNPDEAELQHVQTIAARLSNPPFAPYS